MDFIREMVSGKNKNRFKEHGYNLDLTYICPRIVAMSFPGEGLKVAFRNKLSDVASFIQERHQMDFQVYNLSGIEYDYKKLNDHVFDFPWADHHAPPMPLLFRLCKHIDDFLCGKLSNVVFIHCLAGKGRTGTAICCYMLYSGRFQTADEALQYYAKKRFSKGGGVTQPSQIRYVHYFEQLLNKNTPPIPKYISNVTLFGVPNFSDKTCRPQLQIYVNGDLQYNDMTKNYKDQRKYRDMKSKELNKIRLQVTTPFVAVGDITIEVWQHGQYKVEQMFRASFNTAFVQDTLHFDKKFLDPHKIMKDDRIPADFAAEIQFTDFCKCQGGCKSCAPYQVKDWITEIVDAYRKRTLEESKTLLFGDIEFDDLNEIKYMNAQIEECGSD